MTVQGREGLVYANDRAARLMGLSSGAELMNGSAAGLIAQIEMIDEAGNPFPVDLLPGRRVLAGEETSEVTIGYRLPGSGEVKWSRVGASPIKNDAGEVVWALNFFLDITTQVRLGRMERILNQVSEVMSTSLRIEPNLAALADVVVPSIATWCGFRILDEFDRPSMHAIVFPDSPEAHDLFNVAEAVATRLDPDQVRMPLVSSGPDEHFGGLTDETRQKVAREIGEDAARILEELEVSSVLSVPLGAGGMWLGTMILVRTESDGDFDSLDVAFVRELASRAGVALANSRVYEHEHETAEALRLGLTPLFIPNIPGLEIAARYEPLARTGHVGGDFFDVVDLGEGRVAVFIGDVEGKGVGAAATVGMVRHTLRSTVALDWDPQVVFTQLNRALAEAPHPRMCTIAYIAMERGDDAFTATVALAGHPPPLVVRADGRREEIGKPRPPAGVVSELEATPRTTSLQPGDTLLAYTDGFAMPELQSPRAVVRFLGSVGDLSPDEVLDGMLKRFHEEVPVPRDDIAMLAVKVVREA